jgi:hypothetical protein
MSKKSRCLLIVLNINDSLLPLASWNTTLEHDVNLTIRSTLHLRKAEVGNDQTTESSSAPNVTTLATNCIMLAMFRRVSKIGKLTVTSGGVKHVRSDCSMSVDSLDQHQIQKLTENAREFDHVVNGTTESSGKRSKTNSRSLSNENPRSGSRTQGEEN